MRRRQRDLGGLLPRRGRSPRGGRGVPSSARSDGAPPGPHGGRAPAWPGLGGCRTRGLAAAISSPVAYLLPTSSLGSPCTRYSDFPILTYGLFPQNHRPSVCCGIYSASILRCSHVVQPAHGRRCTQEEAHLQLMAGRSPQPQPFVP